MKEKQEVKHGVPALCSLFVPGLGQMIKGEIAKGICFFVFTPIGYICLILPGLALHLYSVIDAYNKQV